MKEDVLKRIIEIVEKGTEIALKQNTEYEKWITMSSLLASISGLCNGAILMDKKDSLQEE